MNDTMVMRPKLKQDSVFLQVQGGAFLRSDTTAFLLKGKSIYRWLSALIPYMTGEHTLEEICAGLGPGQHEMVTQLVETLLQRGVIKNYVPEASDRLGETETNYFKSQIEFLDHFVDRPLERFKAFRESRLLLVGSGETLLSLAISLLRNGLQEIMLASSDEPIASIRSILEKEIKLLRQHDVEATLTLIDLQTLHAGISPDHFDLVAYCSDKGTLQEILAWQQRCLLVGLAFLPAVVFGEWASIGPLVEATGKPCWLCAQMRLAANEEELQSSARWRELALGRSINRNTGNCCVPQARRIGNGLAFELFKLLTGVLPAETKERILLQDLETLESYSAPLVFHPLCPSCSHMDVDIAIQQMQEIIAGKHDKEFASDEEMLLQADPLVNKRTGLFKEFIDDKLIQLPLKMSHLRAGPPTCPLAGNIAVTTFSTETLLEARSYALLEASTRYVQSLPDKRALLTGSLRQLEERGLFAVPAQQLTTWAGIASFTGETICEWSPAFALFSQRLCYIPAAAVYSLSSLNHAYLFEKTTMGSGTAATFHELLTNGVLAAHAYEEMLSVVQGHNRVVQLALEMLEDIGPTITFLIRCASHFERPYTLLEIQSETPIHIILASTTDGAAQQITAVGFALSAREAIRRALTSLVGQLQHHRYEVNIPALNESLVPGIALSADLINNKNIANELRKPDAPFEHLTHYLQEHGREAIFINLTTTDIWEKGPFMSGTVLLARINAPLRA
ncbi:hypothetical protein EPA93_46300 [Ktedonosporobacter rubrisoli]|uniref:YcaO domain-containing protein n=1 Tax=Ktedonosporobacter rubrisoli TaxID=2509675 RepID=A0A4P6K4K2_KTERU|nr:TOMM precursor leader peptide-binding protein [Ktedonosporobacter rubrisoli]QBD82985.1 hypothetical protein EPA93_46300 [Ktedonosporobacter rubrisoli]